MAITIAATPWAGSNQNPAYHGTFIPEIWLPGQNEISDVV